MSIIATAPAIPASANEKDVLRRLHQISAMAGLGFEATAILDDTGNPISLTPTPAQTDYPVDPFQQYTDNNYQSILNEYNTATNQGTAQNTASGSTATNAFVNLLNSWSATGQKILLNDSLPRGIYMTKGANGQVTYYSQPTGSGSIPIASGNVNVSASGGTMTTLLIVGAAAVALVVVMQMSKR